MLHQTRWFMLVIPLLGILLGGCATKHTSDFFGSVPSAQEVRQDVLASGGTEEEAEAAARRVDDPKVDRGTHLHAQWIRNNETQRMELVQLSATRDSGWTQWMQATGGVANLGQGFGWAGIGAFNFGLTTTKERVDWRGRHSGSIGHKYSGDVNFNHSGQVDHKLGGHASINHYGNVGHWINKGY